MSRGKAKSKVRKTYEWRRGLIANVGVVSPLPYDIIFNHIREKNVCSIVDLFFDGSTKAVDLLDLCVLEQFWWANPHIVGARYSRIEHSAHYSGEYIFDAADGERTITEVRQPDIDGKHWCADHIHIKRGTADLEDATRIRNPTFNEHIELKGSVIQGVYIMKAPN